MEMKGLVLLQCAGVDIFGTADSLAFIQASLLLLLLATSEGDFLFLPCLFTLQASEVGYPFSQE
jgi:hypothetical protein